MNNDLYTVLRRIGRGYLFLHFHIRIGTLDLLPDWLGYYWILLGIWALAKEIPSAVRLEPFAIGMTAWCLLSWIVKIFGGSLEGPLVSLVVTAVTLYLHFQLLTDIGILADNFGCSEGETLRRLRVVYAVCNGLSLLGLLPLGVETQSGLVIVLSVLTIIVVIRLVLVLRRLSCAITEIPVPLGISDYVQPEPEEVPEPEEENQ